MWSKIANYLLIILLLSAHLIKAQDSTQTNINYKVKVDKSYIKSYFTDVPKIIISPVKWNKKEWIAAGTVFTTAGIFYAKDKEVMKWVQDNLPNNFETMNTYFFDPYGKGYFTIPLMAGTYLLGTYSKDNKLKAVSMDFFKATAISGLLITGIKHLAHRNRPFQTDPLNPYIWDGPNGNLSHTSFPSGHTIMAFTFASVISEHYKDKVWIPITVYTLAGLEAYARLGAKKHWASDVIIGEAMGYAIGTWVVNHSNYKFMVNPWVNKQSVGVNAVLPI